MAVDVGGHGSTIGLRPAKKTPKPKATVTQKRTRTGNSTSTGYRGSSGNSGSSGNGFSGSGSSASYKPPTPPSLSSYLGTDSAYQNSLRGSKRSLTDFLSDLGRRRGEAGTQFTQTQSSMERDRTQQLDELRQEFASRGLINSGLYGQEQGNFQKKFQEQMTALKQQQTALLADLLSQEKNYRRENDLANEQARQEAILRRAQKYGIG